MVAVVLAAGSLNGYAAALASFDQHEHGMHGLHDHGAHAHAGHHDDGDASSDVADATQKGGEDPYASCGMCQHVHVHTCCAYGVPPADVTLKLTHERVSIPVAGSHIPPGQLATPLFRPPRAIA